MRRIKKYGIYMVAISVQTILLSLYGLNFVYTALLGIVAILSLHKIFFYIQREKEYENRYVEVVTYLEQLLCSYRRTRHAAKAMADCITIFETDSKMGKFLMEARHILLTGEGVEGSEILGAAFQKIEEGYDSRRMRLIHQFVGNGERTGGDIAHSADILLEDLQLWRNRTRLYQNKKRFIKAECGVATVLAIVFCGVSKILTPKELGIDICDSTVYQISTVIVFMILWYILTCIYKKLSGEWLDIRKKSDLKEQKRLWRLYGVLRQGQGNNSYMTTHIAKRVVGKYVKQEFPYWLLLVTLYLQSESTYQALRYSLKETEGIFYEEIKRLTEEIYDSPRGLEPYLQFFGMLNLPEVQTGMKILYSVSANGYEDSKRQMDFLVAQNNRLMDQCESYVQENQTAGMSMLKQLPMIVSCFKLLVDLVNLLALTMSNFQSVNF